MVRYWIIVPLWNDADLVRVLLRHYKSADRIIFYDAASDDGGPELALTAGREVRSQNVGDRMCDSSLIDIKNSVWKEATGIADFVIIQDVDELIFFPDYPNNITAALKQWKDGRVTHSSVVSYAVVASEHEWQDVLKRLPLQHPTLSIRRGSKEDPVAKQMGMPPNMYDKPLIIDPSALYETNFFPGQHDWSPFFRRNPVPPRNPPAMLHLRYVGEAREFNRTRAMRERLRHQFQKGWGRHYNLTDDEIRQRVKMIYDEKNHLNLFPGAARVTQVMGFRDFICYVYGNQDYISIQLAAGFAWEPKVAATIARLCSENTLFIDVGANLGCHTFVAVMCGARVVAFEPHPTTAAMLTRSVMANGWEDFVSIRQLAVSDHDDKIVRLTDNPTNMGASSVEIAESGQEFEVLTTRLDSQRMPDYPFYEMVIKIDIEGHEESAIRGMPKILADSRMKAVIIELNLLLKHLESLISNVCQPIVKFGFTDIRIIQINPIDQWAGLPLGPGLPASSIDLDELSELLINKSCVVELLFMRPR